MGIGALDRRNTLRNRLTGFAAIGAGLHNAAEIDVTGSRKQVDAVGGAPGRFSAVDGIIIYLKYFGQLAVGFRIIVAVFWGMIEETVPDLLLPGKILVKDFHQPWQRNPALVKDFLPD